MIRLIAAITFIFCFVPGCEFARYNVCEGHFRISHRWPAAEQQIIRESVARWNAFAGYEAIFIDGIAMESNSACLIRPQYDWEEVGLDESPNRVGTYQSHDGVIRIKYSDDLKLNVDRFSTVVVHEMGHALGLGHISKTGDLMSVQYNSNVLDFTERDRDMCVVSGVCLPLKDIAK